MARILKRDFTDATHCGRCVKGRQPFDLGIAYVFEGVGRERFAGPHCAERDADNWNSFPDFTRAFATLDREIEDALAADGAFDQAVARVDGAEHLDPAGAEAVRARPRDINGLEGPRLRAVLEYLGLRVKLGKRFSAFPCPDFLVGIQRRVDGGDGLTAREARAVLTVAASYRRINARATPSALQACYALDVSLSRLIAQVGSGEYPTRIQKELRCTGQLTEGQYEGLLGWFQPRDRRIPNVRPILR